MPKKPSSKKTRSALPKSKKIKRYSLYQEDALKKLSSEGNSDARYALDKRKLVKKMATDHTFGEGMEISHTGDGLWLLFKKELGHVKLLIEVEENTKINEVRNSWKEIDFWRDLLKEWQGSLIWDKADKLFSILDKLHRDGTSYLELAQGLNKVLEMKLVETQCQGASLGDYVILDTTLPI